MQSPPSRLEVPAVSTKGEESLLLAFASEGVLSASEFCASNAPGIWHGRLRRSLRLHYLGLQTLCTSLQNGQQINPPWLNVSKTVDPDDYDKCSGRFEQWSHLLISK